jgi:hypothetical protein
MSRARPARSPALDAAVVGVTRSRRRRRRQVFFPSEGGGSLRIYRDANLTSRADDARRVASDDVVRFAASSVS